MPEILDRLGRLYVAALILIALVVIIGEGTTWEEPPCDE